ncbi:unnamed protein product [Enterobius vermicularis]|uniref:Uncharacterized protein n=1 Tax=Enterobius vermicularis TaxID=51028 RepID=A0A0N4V8U1_ENTVE|nr:unnamed protein product [Enterobius vermicularis]
MLLDALYPPLPSSIRPYIYMSVFPSAYSGWRGLEEEGKGRRKEILEYKWEANDVICYNDTRCLLDLDICDVSNETDSYGCLMLPWLLLIVLLSLFFFATVASAAAAAAAAANYDDDDDDNDDDEVVVVKIVKFF